MLETIKNVVEFLTVIGSIRRTLFSVGFKVLNAISKSVLLIF